jgi:biotin-dependent carboxylase-like uncharacterized protein
MLSAALLVRRPGPLTTVQDLGRPGWAHLGVPVCGALDQPALRLANRLVGNPDHAAGLEVTLGGCVFEVESPVTVALTGARAPFTVDGSPVAVGVAVQARRTVEVGRATAGLRAYLGVGGGIAVPPVLGSRSTDTLSGLGPAPLRAGDRLPLAAPSESAAPSGPAAPSESAAPSRPAATSGPAGPDLPAAAPPGSEVTLRVRFGPRQDWFTPKAVRAMLRCAYTMSPKSNRVGARLAGTALPRANAAELPSEGLVLGAVQVPADGQPLVFLADHPTTGGYPVIAVVDAADLPALAQCRPGGRITFEELPGN